MDQSTQPPCQQVYNNGGKSEKVAFEHEVLAQLGKQTLSFQVPRAKPALKNGARHVKLSSGDDACVFEIIPGACLAGWGRNFDSPAHNVERIAQMAARLSTCRRAGRCLTATSPCPRTWPSGTLAKTTSPQEVGRATGELCTAMAAIDMADPTSAPVPPYYDVFAVHHSMNRELFYKQVRQGVCMNVIAAAAGDCGPHPAPPRRRLHRCAQAAGTRRPPQTPRPLAPCSRWLRTRGSTCAALRLIT